MPEQPTYIHIDPTFEKFKAYLNVLPPHVRIFILTDSNTQKFCWPILSKVSNRLDTAHLIEIPPGEKFKNQDSLLNIAAEMIRCSADKNCLLINLGGGVVCDIGGFAASIYKRGIKFIHVPTTLLAMLDASVGGKNGIDFAGYKNILGTIHFPENVFIYTPFLDTLPADETRNGMAEALKHALIADASYWDEIKQDPLKDPDLLIEQSIAIKSSIVIQDPLEKNIRKKLNAGHTIGHALESWKLENNHPVMHGQAVAAGLIIESYISKQLGYLSSKEFDEMEERIVHTFGKMDLTGYNAQDLIQRMQQDKKNSSGQISFSLIRHIGNASIDDHCEYSMIADALEYYAAT